MAAGEGALRTWIARSVARDDEVVDQRAVAGDGLGADAGVLAALDVLAPQLGQVAAALGDEGAGR